MWKVLLSAFIVGKCCTAQGLTSCRNICMSQALRLFLSLCLSLALSFSPCMCVIFSSVQKLWQKCMTCESRCQGQTTNWFPMRGAHTLPGHTPTEHTLTEHTHKQNTHSQNTVVLSFQMVSCFTTNNIPSWFCLVQSKLCIFSIQHRRIACAHTHAVTVLLKNRLGGGGS